ncbi:MAG: hypothetical protein IJP23_03380 [Oscillospiraceae bacterium]|nr:hypothetical protein [Oscillospiraceae bacterium]
MKQFIYLDTDIVNSIIAQKEKGLVLETASEHEDTAGKENTKTGSVSLDGSVGGGIWKFAQAQAELSGTGGVELNSHSQTVLKEIATKTLHDAAFDIAYEQIHKEYDTSPKDACLGSFVELKQSFGFVDLEYIESLFSDENSFLKFMKKSEKEKIEARAAQEISENLNREQQRKNEAELKKRVKELVDANNKQYEDISDIVKALRQIVPYKRMLVSSDGYLIPLEDKYFRDNPQTMGFKHGGDVTCLGYITNIIGETSVPNSDNIFSQLQALVNQTLISILPTREKDLFVVHPIAIYYGE